MAWHQERALPGGYVLERRIASGGMGDVWRAAHPRLGFPVAVKVLRAAQPRGRPTAPPFELYALASLAHPAVLRVFDHGFLAEPLWASADDAIPAGHAFMVTEYASGGDLGGWLFRPRAWPVIAAVLASVLDALAQAHAQGILHLDIKPGNLLWCANQDLRPGVKLADFGISARVGDLWATLAGTPGFRAPEQITSDRRHIGPWTDLHGLGALAWALVHGRLPWSGDRPRGLGELALHPDWGNPRIPVPAGLPAWVSLLLAERPGDRFQRAADAAWALRRLDSLEDDSPPRTADVAPWEDPNTVIPRPQAATEIDTGEVEEGAPLADSAPLNPMPTQPPPLPASWPLDEWAADPFDNISAAARPLPALRPRIIGREAEKILLWEALERVCAQRKPAAVVLRGATGMGKARLATWLAEQAHAAGAAEVWTAVHRDPPGPQDGLWAMLRRALRCEGLSDERLSEALLEVLPSDTTLREGFARTLVAMMSAEASPALGRDAGPRFSALGEALRGLVRERVGVMVIDAAHLAGEALSFVSWALRGSSLPVLYVLTAVDAREGDDAPRSAELARLLSLPEVEQAALGPLPEHRWVDLAEASGPLPPGVREAIARRAAGVPLVALAHVEAWRERGAVPTALTGDPASALWVARLEQLLSARPPEDRIALELAAVLGVEVRMGEWLACCDEAGVPVADDLLPGLVRLGLASQPLERSDESWVFTPGLLAELLLAGAAREGQAEQRHRAAARALERLGGCPGDRLGRHLACSGDPRGVTMLLDAAKLLRDRGLFGETLLCVGMARATLERLEVAAPDPRWGEAALVELNTLAAYEGASPQLTTLSERLLADAERYDWPAVRLRLRLRVGHQHHDGGRFQEGLALVEELRQEVSAPEFAEYSGFVEALHGRLLTRIGDYAGAELHLERAIQQLQHAPYAISVVRQCQADVLLLTHRYEAARETLAPLLAQASDEGAPQSMVVCLNSLGETWRKQGEIEEARRCYLSAIALGERHMTTGLFFPTVNLALVDLERGAYVEAHRALQLLLAQALSRRSLWLELYLRVLLIGCAAGFGNLTALEEQLDRADPLSAQVRYSDEDMEVVLSRAVQALAGAAPPELLARVDALAARLKVSG